MHTQWSFQAQFPAHRAFVVQLREGTALTPQGLQGRVEHITSGQATDFHSLAALLAFMQAVLTPPAVPSPAADLPDRTT